MTAERYSFDVNIVVDNIKKLVRTKSINKIAATIGVTSAGLHSAIKRGELPLKALVSTAIMNGWSLDQLFGIDVSLELNKAFSHTYSHINYGKQPCSVRFSSEPHNTEVVLSYYDEVILVLDSYFGPETNAFQYFGPEVIYEIRPKLSKILLEQALAFNGNRDVLEAIVKTALAVLLYESKTKTNT